MIGGSGSSASSGSYVDLKFFTSYEDSGDSSLIFSARHIDSLTVEAAVNLELPQICSGKFQVLEWTRVVPEKDVLNLNGSSFIPSLADIRPFLIDGAHQFARGMRSVRVDFRGTLYSIMAMKLS